ncbi:MAG: hypothetical protein IPM46_03710 [Flavobacteriales bacterium]|nr:hypothetical protein [Flavobacteriales bacterium]
MLLRTLLSSVVTAAALVGFGQSPGFLFFQAEAPVNRSQYKFIIEAVMNVDAQAEVFHSDDMTILQVKSPNMQGEQVYRSAITSTGIALQPGLRSAESLGINATPAVPVYVSTGNDADDLARYQAAVAEWNTAHPEQTISAIPVHLSPR